MAHGITETSLNENNPSNAQLGAKSSLSKLENLIGSIREIENIYLPLKDLVYDINSGVNAVRTSCDDPIPAENPFNSLSDVLEYGTGRLENSAEKVSALVRELRGILLG